MPPELTDIERVEGSAISKRTGASRVIVFIVLALLSPWVSAQTRPLETPPPDEPSFGALADWLENNSGHSAFPDELDRLLDLAGSMEEIERVTTSILSLVANQSVLASTAKSLGNLWMTARDYARATDLFETAYIASGGADLASLFAAAQTQLQLGEVAAAGQRARLVVAETTDYELKRRAYALVARALHLQGRSADAARLLETLAALDDPTLVEPDALILQSTVLGSLDADAAGPIEQLARLHPQSVAMRIVNAELVFPASLPVSLLTGLPPVAPERDSGLLPSLEIERIIDSPADSSAGDSPPRTQAPVVTAIQVGSFSDSENAHHLADDLRDIGLEALAESVERDGRTLELVLVSVPDGSPEQASRILGVLRAAGYDGFLIY